MDKAAIVAQIAILSFDKLGHTHWVTRASFPFSLLSSLVAVYYAVTQKRFMDRLQQPLQIRTWIRGKATDPGHPHEYQLDPQNPAPMLHDMSVRLFCPSIAAVMTISAPQVLLSSSLLSLLVGIGLYFGFTWTRGLDEDAGKGDSRNIMVIYMVSIGVCLAVYSISHLLQDENTEQERDIVEGYVLKFFEGGEEAEI